MQSSLNTVQTVDPFSLAEDTPPSRNTVPLNGTQLDQNDGGNFAGADVGAPSVVTAKGGEEGREEAENDGEGEEDVDIIVMVAAGSCFILTLITILACKQQC